VARLAKIAAPNYQRICFWEDKDGNDVEIYFNPVDGSIVTKK